jgi:hypothetical protein
LWKSFRKALFPILILLTAACVPVEAQPVEPTDTPAPTQVPSTTPTIVWFPPTETYTPMPTQVQDPTPEMHPGVGGFLLQDDFSSPGSWLTRETAAGSVAYGQNELTIAISTPKSLLLSLRSQPIFGDFYMEVTANASLCRGSDAYGLLLRAAGDKDFYRFVITCAGQMRLERVKNSQTVPLSDWTISGEVPPGSPLFVRIGVWAAGSELRFFLNDVYIFSARDPVFKSGLLGVFARSGGNNAVSISFSELVVRDVNYVPVPTLPPTPTTNKKLPRPSPTRIQPVFQTPIPTSQNP